MRTGRGLGRGEGPAVRSAGDPEAGVDPGCWSGGASRWGCEGKSGKRVPRWSRRPLFCWWRAIGRPRANEASEGVTEMKRKNPTCWMAVAAVGSVASGTASADVFDVFDDRSAWLAAAGGPATTEGFEGGDALGALGSPSVFASGLGVAVTEPAASVSVVECCDPTQVLLQNTTPGGEQYIRFGGGQLENDYTQQYLLPTAVSAFGFDIVDWEPGEIANGPQGADVELYNGNDLVMGFFLPSTLEEAGNVAFIGFASTDFTFDQVRFTVREGLRFNLPFLDVTGVDEVSWVVPSPGSAMLVVMAGVCAARRRRSV